MKTLIDLITEQVTNAFTGQGYDAKYGKVTLSNRPDLCEYQCNGAMAAAKEYKCAPFMISDKIAQALAENELFESVESVKPGFINMKVSPAYLAKYVSDMKADEGRFGCDKAAHPKTIIVDYGRGQCCQAIACRTSALCCHWREYQADRQIYGTSHDR